MRVKSKLFSIVIALATVSFAGHVIAAEYQAPETLEEIINITRGMVNELRRLDPIFQLEAYQKKRQQIAKWVVLVSSERIYNCNDTEYYSNPLRCWDLKQARKKWNANSNNNEMIAKWAWENRAGNCEENANVTYYILRKAGVTESLRILFSKDWHGFTVWGVQYSAKLNEPLTWNPGALVLDSWAGKVLTPVEAQNDYYIKNGGSNTLEDRTLAYDTTACGWNVNCSASGGNDFWGILGVEPLPFPNNEEER
jgi:hypothetical protein